MVPLLRLLLRARWFASRLAVMPLAEFPHRFAEARRRMIWRRDPTGWRAFEGIGDGALADLAALRARLAGIAALNTHQHVAQSVRWSCEGQFTFLGEVWPHIASMSGEPLQIPPAFWFYDPITGRSWPDQATSSFDIDVRSTGIDIGDVKYVWEANRLQMLHPFAAAMAQAQDQKTRRIIFAILESWAAANPPYRGVNWRSGLELALRLVSILLVVASMPPSTLCAEQRVLIRRMVVAHAQYLAAFPSLYSSANNHRVAEGLGLFLAGLMLPDCDAAHEWHEQGRKILEAEAVRQICADGGGVEQSPTYQAFTMEMLALAVSLANDMGKPLDPEVIARLVRGAEFLSWLADENGFVPAIGDDDEGRVIAQLPDREPRYVASVIAAVAGLALRDDLATAAHDPHLRDALFASPQTSSVARRTLRVFEQSGLSVVNDWISGRRIHLVFDHGPLGLAPLAAHGHADALAIWLTIDDEPIFIDAGTYLYFSGGKVRAGLRESLAHNTLAIDGVSHSRVATAFTWATMASGRLVTAAQGPSWWMVGAHDGYRKRFGVRHVRRVARRDSNLTIDDRLIGSRRPRAVTLRFLCHPRVAVAINDGCVTISGRCGPLCRIVPPSGFGVEVAEALHSQCFGHVASAPQLVFAGELADDAATTMIEIADPATADALACDGAAVVRTNALA